MRHVLYQPIDESITGVNAIITVQIELLEDNMVNISNQVVDCQRFHLLLFFLTALRNCLLSLFKMMPTNMYICLSIPFTVKTILR